MIKKTFLKNILVTIDVEFFSHMYLQFETGPSSENGIITNFQKNKPENPFQTMTSHKIANVITPDSS